jgi:hypothetical protein
VSVGPPLPRAAAERRGVQRIARERDVRIRGNDQIIAAEQVVSRCEPKSAPTPPVAVLPPIRALCSSN